MTGKKIFLMRHSIPKRCALSTEMLPFSEEGIQIEYVNNAISVITSKGHIC